MLRYRADVRTLGFVALYFATLASLWNLVPDDRAPRGAEWAWSVPLFVLLCVTSFQGAVSTHNAVHAPIFQRRWLNKLWQVVLTLTYGHPVSSYVPGHNLSHHKHTQSTSDVMRTQKARFRYHGLNLLFFVVSIAPSIMQADATYSRTMFRRHPRWFRQLLLEVVVLAAVTIALFALSWQKALVLWIVPHLYAQWGIVTMNLLQHDGCNAGSRFDHSRNFVNPTLNWFVFNNGFHTIHHHHPGLHWSLAPEAHAREIAPHIHPNLDQPSLLAYVWRTFVLGRRETFDGKPYYPEPAGADTDWLPDPRITPDDLGVERLPA
jgi:fatty acid desaturase